MTSSNFPLPQIGKRNVLVTSALPYVNNYPHLGNIIGAVLSADAHARYLRQRKVNVIYVCGTDEYGTATETKAQQEGLTPREICDKYYELHKEVYAWFDIEFDAFGRTSTPKQTEIVQQLFWDVHKNGYIEEDTTEQLYCERTCKRFLADRYVHGGCPNCGYDDARGDQCDNCGRMLNPSELVSPRCATCSAPPTKRSTTHLFLNLPKIQSRLEEWAQIASVEGNWTTNAKAMTDTWLRDGLKKRAITRDLKWGVPVPLEGYTDKVFYVWFDAPVGYISITANACGDDWKKWWLPSESDEACDVELVQFMGKDNVPFHTIVFPGSLLASDKPWTMLHHISTSEYLNYENGKFSKSRGIGVFGNDAQETGIPPEVWRYYLLLNRPEGSDSAFTWTDLATKNNRELIHNLGNFINRTVTFLHKSFNGVVPDILENDEENVRFTKTINEELNEYRQLMDKVSLKAGLKKAMSISSVGNLYLQTKQPWKLVKEGNISAAGSCLTFAANLAALVVCLVEPFMGSQFSSKAFKQLGLVHTPGVNNIIPDEFIAPSWVQPGTTTEAPVILFTALQPARVEELRTKYAGVQESNGLPSPNIIEDGKSFGLDLRVGEIIDIAEHSDSEKLFIAKVNVGEDNGPRTLVAGLRGVYTKEELLGRKVVCVCNLEPATLAGIDSQAMILCADKKKVMEVLVVSETLAPGELLVPEGMEFSSNKPLDRKRFQAASKPLRVGKNGEIVFDKTHKLVASSNSNLVVKVNKVAEGGKVK